jgi:hypothetical protein
MRARTLRLRAIAALGALAAAGSASAGATACDRACLKGYAEQVLASIVAHDPSTLPLSQLYLATENSAPSTPGLMVIWRTATGVKNRYFVIDPTSEQIFLISTLSEGPSDALLYGRIKVHKARISELELYTSRSRGQGGFQFSADGAANFPKAWTEAIAPERRASRAELLQAGRSIFDTTVPAPDIGAACVIMEDGKIVGENREVAKSVAPTDGGSTPPAATNPDGTVQIPCGNPPIRPVDKNARTTIIDEEQGVVVSLAVVHGMVEPYVITSPTESAFVPYSLLKPYTDLLKMQLASGKYQAPALRPTPATQSVAELHRVYDGKLQGLMMLHSTGAPGSHSPWAKS